MAQEETMEFRPAERSRVKLKAAVQGPSGSGKTEGVLRLAREIVGAQGRIALIDTENDSASYYADEFTFSTINLKAPFTSARYIQAINAAIRGGFDILIIDSISHQWMGEGGILARKEELDKRGGNQWANWATFTKEHTAFVGQVNAADMHIIVTLRAKQDYLVSEKNGKSTPTKVGLAAQQREGFEYEFGVVFELQMDHRARVSKDRTGLFDSEALYDFRRPDVGKMLRGWLRSGKPPLEEKKEPATLSFADADGTVVLDINSALRLPLPGPDGSWGGKAGTAMGEFSDKQLERIAGYSSDYLEDHDDADPASATMVAYRTALTAANLILEARVSGTATAPPAKSDSLNGDHAAESETKPAPEGTTGDGVSTSREETLHRRDERRRGKPSDVPGGPEDETEAAPVGMGAGDEKESPELFP